MEDALSSRVLRKGNDETNRGTFVGIGINNRTAAVLQANTYEASHIIVPTWSATLAAFSSYC